MVIGHWEEEEEEEELSVVSCRSIAGRAERLTQAQTDN